MANFDQLFDVVLEASAKDNMNNLAINKNRVVEIKKKIKEARKTKDVKQMVEISKEIDDLISSIETYRKTEVDYDNYMNVDKVISAYKIVEGILKAFAAVVPVAILAKGTLDGIKSLKDGTLVSSTEKEFSDLNEYHKDYGKLKTAAGIATTGATVVAAGKVAMQSYDRRKLTGSYDHMMKSLGDCINKLKKINEKLRKEIQSEMKKGDKTVKESTEDELKLEIYESCRSGEISEEERDLLLSLM